MTREELALLSDKIAAGIATEQEIAAYYHILEQQQLQHATGWNEAEMGNRLHTGQTIKQQIWHTINKPATRNIPVIRYAAAAAILVLLAGTAFWFTGPGNKTPIAVQPNLITPIGPGGNKATLTLSDGSILSLDTIQSTIISDHSGIQIKNQNNSHLTYQPAAQNSGRRSSQDQPSAFNLLATPRGGQYQLTLPDGTRVWLNAASSIRFPVTFNGNNREVEVTGELYFDIAKNSRQPFIVISKQQRIEVLGTQFCLNAYDDENATRTTLIEGSVKIIPQQQGVAPLVLKPSEQAEWQHINSTGIKTTTPDINTVIAWKNGLFQFNNADVQTIMRQISRWYLVDIKYKSNITGRKLTGKIQRSAQLREVLEMLSYAGLELSVHGNTIEVGN